MTAYTHLDQVVIHTDSQLIINWVNNTTQSQTHAKLVEYLRKLIKTLRDQDCNVQFIKVMSHTGQKWNDRADSLAKMAIANNLETVHKQGRYLHFSDKSSSRFRNIIYNNSLD